MHTFALVQQRSRDAYDILNYFQVAEREFASNCSAQIFKNGVNVMQKNHSSSRGHVIKVTKCGLKNGHRAQICIHRNAYSKVHELVSDYIMLSHIPRSANFKAC